MSAEQSQKFYGAQCPSYPDCTGGCGLGCTHDVEAKKNGAEQKILFPGPTREEREYLAGLAGEPFDPAKPCEYCGAPMGEHVIGGPGKYHPRPFKRVSYDISSFELAERFLDDEPPYLKALTHQLAAEIQRIIEDFIEYERGAESAEVQNGR